MAVATVFLVVVFLFLVEGSLFGVVWPCVSTRTPVSSELFWPHEGLSEQHSATPRATLRNTGWGKCEGYISYIFETPPKDVVSPCPDAT